MKGYIYLIENKINGKKYIGKTYRSVDLRWKEHLRYYEKYPERPLYRAIKKYGEANFEVRELEFTENPEEREIFWIEYYNSFQNGYNATGGGDGTAYFPYSLEEVIQKYNELLSVRETALFFDCQVSTISKRLINSGITLPKGGNIHNPKRSWETKKVGQYSKEGELLREFDSYLQAANWLIENNFSKAQPKHIVSNISKVCRGMENRKHAYNFIWKNL